MVLCSGHLHACVECAGTRSLFASAQSSSVTHQANNASAQGAATPLPVFPDQTPPPKDQDIAAAAAAIGSSVAAVDAVLLALVEALREALPSTTQLPALPPPPNQMPGEAPPLVQAASDSKHYMRDTQDDDQQASIASRPATATVAPQTATFSAEPIVIQNMLGKPATTTVSTSNYQLPLPSSLTSQQGSGAISITTSTPVTVVNNISSESDKRGQDSNPGRLLDLAAAVMGKRRVVVVPIIVLG